MTHDRCADINGLSGLYCPLGSANITIAVVIQRSASDSYSNFWSARWLLMA